MIEVALNPTSLTTGPQVIHLPFMLSSEESQNTVYTLSTMKIIFYVIPLLLGTFLIFFSHWTLYLCNCED